MRFADLVLAAGLPLPGVLARGEPGNRQIPLGYGSDNAGAQGGKKKPNIVFILTDDQDLHMQSLDYLPLIKKHLVDQGTLYRRHYCTTAICCPSRVSLWTGKQAHNTNVTDVSPPYGGYPKFVRQGLNDAYLPVWLQRAGYDTYYVGKLFNAHSVDNYDAPFPRGWNGSDFLLDPYTYAYLNATFQRGRDPPVSYEGQHSVDVVARKALGFLDDAVAAGGGHRPFFLGIAPIAPHSNVEFLARPNSVSKTPNGSPADDIDTLVKFGPPIPASRHAHLFPDARVPRTPNFNPGPDSPPPTAAGWVGRLAPQPPADVAFHDHFHRQRLRALQGVDELVDQVVTRLAEHGLLEDTFVFYTTDNGFHIGQHRLPPGKECGFEEDIHVPLVVRGPGVAAGRQTAGDGVVTTHVDVAPTLLRLAGAFPNSESESDPARAEDEEDGFDFDGAPIPLTEAELDAAEAEAAAGRRREHVAVEFWGYAASEGRLFRFGDEDEDEDRRVVLNNTYKAVRVIGPAHNLYYAVWCSNEHELYDLTTDPYQTHNLLHPTNHPLPHHLTRLISRLDALLFVLKTCRGHTCAQPWRALHPRGDVASLSDALDSRFDAFYERDSEDRRNRVQFDRCEPGYLADAEGPRFETDGVVYRNDGGGRRSRGSGGSKTTRGGVSWSEWV